MVEGGRDTQGPMVEGGRDRQGPMVESSRDRQGPVVRGQKSFKLSNSMSWSDQHCPTKGAYFAMIYLLKKCIKFCKFFINSY